jgi:hypothetical protein
MRPDDPLSIVVNGEEEDDDDDKIMEEVDEEVEVDDDIVERCCSDVDEIQGSLAVIDDRSIPMLEMDEQDAEILSVGGWEEEEVGDGDDRGGGMEDAANAT